MTEYIERDLLLKRFCEKCNEAMEDEPCEPADCLALEVTKSQPAADAAPVVHSYWESYDTSAYIGTDDDGEPRWAARRFYVCHKRKCRYKSVVRSKYCPNCGARMDGDTENAEE